MEIGSSFKLDLTALAALLIAAGGLYKTIKTVGQNRARRKKKEEDDAEPSETDQ